MLHVKTNVTNILTGMAIGAGCMYLLDPANGKRRRALIRDKTVRMSRSLEDGAGVIVRDLSNRTSGIAASISKMSRGRPADDQVLEARIRSEMGRCVSHPHAIHVEVREGHVTLSGDILASEERDLVRRAEKVAGVKEVESKLKMHGNAENFPSLQGGSRREPKFELLQSNWAPGPRFLAGISGAAMVGQGIRAGGIAGFGMSAAGALLLLRAVMNRELSRLLGGRILRGEWEKEKTRSEPALPPSTPEADQPQSQIH